LAICACGRPELSDESLLIGWQGAKRLRRDVPVLRVDPRSGPSGKHRGNQREDGDRPRAALRTLRGAAVRTHHGAALDSWGGEAMASFPRRREGERGGGEV